VVEKGKAIKTLVEVGVRGKEGVQVLHKMASTDQGKWQSFTGDEAVVISNPGALLDGQDVEVGPQETP
jgi:hypothetical protein